MNRLRLFLPLLLAGLLTSAARAEQVIVTLQPTNGSGLARAACPVSCGLPLPPGVVQDVDRLALRADGRIVPAQFEPMIRDPKDRSVRWIRVDTVLDVPADGTPATQPDALAGAVELVLLDAAAPPSGPALASLDEQWINVKTGAMTVMISRKHFTGIDRAWLLARPDRAIDPDYQVFDGVAGGPNLGAERVAYSSGRSPREEIALERNGPVACTVRVSGALSEADKEAADYQVRMTFYRGLPVVRINYTWLKREGERTEWTTFTRAGFELPTCLKPKEGGGFHVMFGGSDHVHEGEVEAARSAAWIYHAEPDRYAMGGTLVGNGDGRARDVMTTGWGAVDNGTVGLAAGRRWFWQMTPADVTIGTGAAGDPALPGPLVSLGLFSDRGGGSFRVCPGMARSHEVFLTLFDAKKRDGVALRMRDCTQPVMLVAPPAYYCRRARPADSLLPASEAEQEFQEPGLKAERTADEQIERMVDWYDFQRNSVTSSLSYCYRTFGDFPAGRVGSADSDVLWAGNPYDFPHVNYQQWLRTGDAKYFRAFYESATQLLDSHTVLADPEAANVGRPRPCPAQDQVMQNGRPWVCPSFRYLHVRGMVDRALVSADPWALEVAWRAMERADADHTTDSLYNEPASVGNQMLALVEAWRLSGRGEYLDHCKKIVGFAGRFQDRFDGLYFPQPEQLADTAVTCEGMLAYYRVTRDAAALDSVRRHIEAMVKGKLFDDKAVRAGSAAFAYPLAYLAGADGKPAWRDLAIGLLGQTEPLSSLSDRAAAVRTCPQALWFITRDGADEANPAKGG
ncbi:MAG: hypothetical protein BIFFINMI_03760 [Phycisphaerae bacterium]|nr:hypothetical protein [Phycisphaerae bacterium]